MSENSKGWISLHRQIQDNFLWQEKPFDKKSAWIDMLLMANTKDNRVLVGNKTILVKKGQKITSIRQLCKKWGWSNEKVKNFLELLVKEGMILYTVTKNYTAYSIVNYEKYQGSSEDKEEKRLITQKQPSNPLNNRDCKVDNSENPSQTHISNPHMLPITQKQPSNADKIKGLECREIQNPHTKPTYQTNTNNNIDIYILSIVDDYINIYRGLVKNVPSTTQLKNFLKKYDKETMDKVIEEIKKSTWLKDNFHISRCVTDKEYLEKITTGFYRDFKSRKTKTNTITPFHNFEGYTTNLTTQDMEEMARRKTQKQLLELQAEEMQKIKANSS